MKKRCARKTCRKTFVVTHGKNKQVYCSTACSDMAKNERKKVLCARKGCGNYFVKKCGSQKHCSPKCHDIAAGRWVEEKEIKKRSRLRTTQLSNGLSVVQNVFGKHISDSTYHIY